MLNNVCECVKVSSETEKLKTKIIFRLLAMNFSFNRASRQRVLLTGGFTRAGVIVNEKRIARERERKYTSMNAREIAPQYCQLDY
jgi:hypothetical protein